MLGRNTSWWYFNFSHKIGVDISCKLFTYYRMCTYYGNRVICIIHWTGQQSSSVWSNWDYLILSTDLYLGYQNSTWQLKWKHVILLLNMMGKISADDILQYFFQTKGLEISCKLSPIGTIFISRSLFSEKYFIRKISSICVRCIGTRAVKVKVSQRLFLLHT